MEEFELPSFLVVPDTNVLYSKKPEYIVSQKFTDLWSEMRAITSLQLLVPEAVQEELIFQQVFIGQQARENATKSLSTIASVTAKKRTNLPTDKTLRTAVAKTFMAWAKDNNSIVVKTPIDKIDWSHVVKNSLHRLPPFSQPSAVGDDTEKGFRDALILETLKHIWVEHPDENIVFLSNDPLLYDAARAIGKGERLLFFKIVDEFQSHLKLLQEEKGNKFIDVILAQAPLEFWNPKETNNVYNNLQIWKKITTEYSLVLNTWLDADQTTSPALGGTTLGGILEGIGSSNALWNPVGDQKIYINQTEFEKLEDPRQYFWKTNLTFVRLCQRQVPSPYGTVGFQLAEKIREASFTVHWSSEISARGKFSNHALGNIEYGRKKYEEATNMLKVRYGFLSQGILPLTSGEGSAGT